ncbi:MAG: DUF2723 domain-containing protein [Chloroflexota bacterium]
MIQKFILANHRRLIPSVIALILFALYLSTLAQTLVLGDPTEFTFIANILGIAHPPGYVFITLMGKLFQTVIPFGTTPWRMHLLAAVSATAAAMFVYGTIRLLTPDHRGFKNLGGLSLHYLPAIFGALTVGTAVNHWQHAIHTNPHIITATFLSANFYFLTKWYREEERREKREERGVLPTHSHAARSALFAFCFSAGLGVTHHPLTVMAFPAYALFIIWIRPSILKEWRTILKMLGFALLGLSLWLYYPLRSPAVLFGPTTMNTVDGFLDHVLARGLSDSLPYFPLVEQPNRALVFWSILRLQYSLPVILLTIGAIISTVFGKVAKWQSGRVAKSQNHEAPSPHSSAKLRASYPITQSPNLPITSTPIHQYTNTPTALFTLAFLTTYAFVISLRQQDIMAYLLGPLLVCGLLAGIGLLQLSEWLQKRLRGEIRPLLFIISFVILLGPIQQIARNLPRVSLRNYSESIDYVNAIEAQFGNSNENAILLNDWERMTPLWHEFYVNNSEPKPVDVSLKYIAAGANPWLDGIFSYLAGHPVYLSNFRQRELGGTEFRLRPAGAFYQVVEPCNYPETPCDQTLPPEMTLVTAVADQLTVVGYYLPEQEVTAGDFVELTLAMTAPEGTADFYIPVLTVGDITYEFTTDSHLITPNWRPTEIIIERFDFALPFDLAAGEYPLEIDLKNLSQNQLVETDLSLGVLTVAESSVQVRTSHLLANFRQRVGLVSASVRGNGRRLQAPWPNEQAIQAQPGDVFNIRLTWEALAIPEESYTIFVHLIDTANQPYVALDYTPLGGSTPTHLWIPKWLPGQRFIDPYRMVIPENLPPGTYYIEVGLYEFIGQRRLHISDQNGNLAGDRYILGRIEVRPKLP